MKLTIILILIFSVSIFIFFNLKTKKDIIQQEFLKCEIDEDCVVSNIECCNNGEPWQLTCVNKNYSNYLKLELDKMCKGGVCPMYLVMHEVNCYCGKDFLCHTNYTFSNNISIDYIGRYKK